MGERDRPGAVDPAGQDLDPRLLSIPPSWLRELGLDLTPYVGRWLIGGCPRCTAKVRLLIEGDGFRRQVLHQAWCVVPPARGRMPGAWMN